ncbi:MAG: hypothetical protein H6659_18580 [Ardenticatenaceae bacterium]|nr:hypothetical protein [Ardenticatenaceae bacterium]
MSALLDYMETTIGCLRLPPVTDESQLDWEWSEKMDKVIRDMNDQHEAVKNMKS